MNNYNLPLSFIFWFTSETLNRYSLMVHYFGLIILNDKSFIPSFDIVS